MEHHRQLYNAKLSYSSLDLVVKEHAPCLLHNLASTVYLKKSLLTALASYPFWASQLVTQSSAALTAADFCPGIKRVVSLLAAKLRMNWRREYSAAVSAFMIFMRSRSRGFDRRRLSLTAALAAFAMLIEYSEMLSKMIIRDGLFVKDGDGAGTVAVVAAYRREIERRRRYQSEAMA